MLPVDDGSTMQAFVARPAVTKNAPGIMVIQDAFGVNEHFKDIATRFAAEGFLAIVPEMYHRTGTNVQLGFGDIEAAKPHSSVVTIEMTQADIRATFAWLTGPGGVAKDRVASIGYCLGGRVTYLANAIVPLTAAVSYYGGSLHTPQYVASSGTTARADPDVLGRPRQAHPGRELPHHRRRADGGRQGTHASRVLARPTRLLLRRAAVVSREKRARIVGANARISAFAGATLEKARRFGLEDLRGAAAEARARLP